jgi:hypothetical protein
VPYSKTYWTQQGNRPFVRIPKVFIFVLLLIVCENVSDCHCSVRTIVRIISVRPWVLSGLFPWDRGTPRFPSLLSLVNRFYSVCLSILCPCLGWEVGKNADFLHDER